MPRYSPIAPSPVALSTRSTAELTNALTRQHRAVRPLPPRNKSQYSKDPLVRHLSTGGRIDVESVCVSESVRPVQGTRRRLTGKRAETVRKLSEAAAGLLVEIGYPGLTVQAVAERAGVTRATAYIYFSSKDHLIAELYWREFSDPEDPIVAQGTPAERVVVTMRQAALTLAERPAVARAAYHALLSNDVEVRDIRMQLAAEMRRRIANALGPNADDTLVELLDLVYTGAVMRAGTGHVSYEKVAALLETAAARVIAGS